MPTTILNLTDLDNIIRRFEQQYQVTSLEMLKNTAVRSKISEDVLLRWETYVEQRIRLRDASDRTHRCYLSDVEEDHRGEKSGRRLNQQAAFAA